jgi:hypothetical protein
VLNKNRSINSSNQQNKGLQSSYAFYSVPKPLQVKRSVGAVPIISDLAVSNASHQSTSFINDAGILLQVINKLESAYNNSKLPNRKSDKLKLPHISHSQEKLPISPSGNILSHSSFLYEPFTPDASPTISSNQRTNNNSMGTPQVSYMDLISSSPTPFNNSASVLLSTSAPPPSHYSSLYPSLIPQVPSLQPPPVPPPQPPPPPPPPRAPPRQFVA